MKRAIWYAMVVTMVACGLAVSLVAQQGAQPAASAKQSAAYRLEFVFSELQDGKKVSSRHYEMLAQEGQVSRLRAGVRVPVISIGTAPSNYQYVDVGMNIDCRLQEQSGDVELDITAESSNFTVSEGEKTTPIAHAPIIQQPRTQVDTLVSPGKPTLVSSMDDPSSKRRFQLEVTATKAR